mgnify:CR=1 FL=1
MPGHITDKDRGFAALFPDCLLRFQSVGFIDIHKKNPGSFPGKEDGDRLAGSCKSTLCASAGHDGCFIFQSKT